MITKKIKSFLKNIKYILVILMLFSLTGCYKAITTSLSGKNNDYRKSELKPALVLPSNIYSAAPDRTYSIPPLSASFQPNLNLIEPPGYNPKLSPLAIKRKSSHA